MAESEPGYHLSDITRGVFGDLSKVFEEIDELDDAAQQGITLLILQELSDTIGAIKGYLAKHHPSITLDDLNDMAVVTQRVFENGHRKPANA